MNLGTAELLYIVLGYRRGSVLCTDAIRGLGPLSCGRIETRLGGVKGHLDHVALMIGVMMAAIGMFATKRDAER
jgi:hypothetical protein